MNKTIKQGLCIVLMGVSGTGKSSVGKILAKQLHALFIDGDDLHPKANILKMSAGKPLNDRDRKPWLKNVRNAAFNIYQHHETGVIACSALKRSYRETIQEQNPHMLFLHLHGDFELIAQRIAQRQQHFMSENLLQSQFNTLELPTDDEANIRIVDINAALEIVVNRCIKEVCSFQSQQLHNDKNDKLER
ncbi:MAG: Thermoresistant gluconokinase [Candidatus Celerinatantimonas neptuna]|nr:MAG: Thermoresistant gluconokinase [Candidatus Celerinatantimonas neptuna]